MKKPHNLHELADKLKELDGASRDDSFVRLVIDAQQRVDEVLGHMLATLPGRPEGKGHVFFYGRQSKDEYEQKHTEASQSAEFEDYYTRKLADMEKRWPPFFDKDVSGGTSLFRRPAGSQMNSMLRRGDHLVITKLDRAWRSTFDGLKTLLSFEARGISVHILNMGLDMSTPTGRLTVRMLLAFAEHERDMTSVRTKEGLATWRRKGGKRRRWMQPIGWKWQGTHHNKVLVEDPISRRFCQHCLDLLKQWEQCKRVVEVLKYEGAINPRTKRPYTILAVRQHLRALTLGFPQIDRPTAKKEARKRALKFGSFFVPGKRDDGEAGWLVERTFLGDCAMPTEPSGKQCPSEAVETNPQNRADPRAESSASLPEPQNTPSLTLAGPACDDVRS